MIRDNAPHVVNKDESFFLRVSQFFFFCNFCLLPPSPFSSLLNDQKDSKSHILPPLLLLHLHHHHHRHPPLLLLLPQPPFHFHFHFFHKTPLPKGEKKTFLFRRKNKQIYEIVFPSQSQSYPPAHVVGRANFVSMTINLGVIRGRRYDSKT